MSEVELIMLNYNNLEFTRTAVASLYKHTRHPFHLYLVDNASTEPGTEEYLSELESKYRNVTVIRSERPDSGFSEGNNKALRLCTAEFVGLINNDLLFVDPDWLGKLVSVLEERERAVLVGPKLLYPDGSIQSAGSYLMPNAFSSLNLFYHRGRFEKGSLYNSTEPMPAVTFACIVARRKEFGLLDEEYKLGTFEDTDKCLELLRKGYELYYTGETHCYHYESATIFTRHDKSKWHRQQLENCIRCRRKWIPWLWRQVQRNPYRFGLTPEQLEEEKERIRALGGLVIGPLEVLRVEV